MPEIPLSLLAIGWAPTLLGGAAAFYLGLRVVRAFERRAGATAEVAALQERVLRLEETVGTLSTELERVAEGSEFTARLLEERK
jgi:hypothetical protein